ncbi:MAG: flagellar export chaperone FlgN, partial [Phycisphaeraceae bacterium]|nr:flagellar export chaperone FlgN [Phycisphaeraceae bacterium]
MTQENNSSQQQAQTLIALLQQQRSVYENLDELSKRQSQLIDSDDTAGLLDLLARRQKVVERLAELNVKFEPFKRSWADFWEPLEEGTQAKIQELIGQVQSMVDRIMAQDEKDHARMAQIRDRMARDAGRLQQGATVNR